MPVSLKLGCIAVPLICLSLSACASGVNFAFSSHIAKPDPALGRFLAARYAETIGDSAHAAQFYMAALQADPHNHALLEEAFLAGVMAGSPQAVQLAPRLPGYALATLMRGNEAVMHGDDRDAAALFQTLPDDQLTGLIQPLLMAWVAFGQGDIQAAQASLRPFLSDSALGGIYTLNAALIADAAGDTRQAAQFYAALPTTAPNLRMAQILASWYARQGDLSHADAILTGLVLAHPDLAMALPQLRAQMYQPVVATPAQGLAEAYLTMAASLSRTQDGFLRAIFLRFALALRPDLSSARLILANTLLTASTPRQGPTDGQLESALATLAPIQVQDPLYSTAVVQEAALNAQLGRPDTAVALLHQLMINHPNDPGLLAAAGDIWRRANQCNLALPYYQRAIVLLGPQPPSNAWSLFFDRGICEDEQGEWAKAAPDIQQALQLSPNQPYVLNYLAYRWAQQGKNLTLAEQMLLSASNLDPNDPAILDSLGFVELKLGNTHEALGRLTQAVQLAPGNAVINAHLGDAFNQAGEPLQAVYQWQKALTLDPDAQLKEVLTTQIQHTVRMMTP